MLRVVLTVRRESLDWISGSGPGLTDLTALNYNGSALAAGWSFSSYLVGQLV